MANPNDIVKLTAMLSAAYPNWNITEYTNDIYFQDLKDIPSDLLFVAAQHCRTSLARDQRFAPSAGEIRAAVSDIKRQASNIPSALEAWNELLKVPSKEETRKLTDERNEQGALIIEVRPYEWSHPLVRKVAVMLGYPRFPNMDSESYERTAFMKAYEIELCNFLKVDVQPAEVTKFIDTSRQMQLPGGEMKLLASKMKG